MSSECTDVVVVLAAGLGSRLHCEETVPKPLREVAGRPLIFRVLDRFKEAGVKEAIIVLGHRGDEIRKAVDTDTTDIGVTYVTNEKYHLGNGLSVLAAAAAVGDRSFFISMADHVFDKEIITGLKAAHLPKRGLILAVDRKLDAIFDMDDATKVRTADARIVAIGKSLKRFDAIDSGLFRCTPALFEAIQAKADTHPEGDCTLSEGVETLRKRGVALIHDIGDARWQDVDTPETEAHAVKVFG